MAFELSITLLNTFALHVDSGLYGYYSAVFVFGTLAARLLVCLLRASFYAVIMPSLPDPLKRTLH